MTWKPPPPAASSAGYTDPREQGGAHDDVGGGGASWQAANIRSSFQRRLLKLDPGGAQAQARPRLESALVVNSSQPTVMEQKLAFNL